MKTMPRWTFAAICTCLAAFWQGGASSSAEETNDLSAIAPGLSQRHVLQGETPNGQGLFYLAAPLREGETVPTAASAYCLPCGGRSAELVLSSSTIVAAMSPGERLVSGFGRFAVDNGGGHLAVGLARSDDAGSVSDVLLFDLEAKTLLRRHKTRTDNTNYSLSPSGEALLYYASDPNAMLHSQAGLPVQTADVAILDVANGHARTVFQAPPGSAATFQYDAHVAWTDDGRNVLFDVWSAPGGAMEFPLVCWNLALKEGHVLLKAPIPWKWLQFVGAETAVAGTAKALYRIDVPKAEARNLVLVSDSSITTLTYKSGQVSCRVVCEDADRAVMMDADESRSRPANSAGEQQSDTGGGDAPLAGTERTTPVESEASPRVRSRNVLYGVAFVAAGGILALLTVAALFLRRLKG